MMKTRKHDRVWKAKDLVGHPPFGRLTVIAMAKRALGQHPQCICLCECGKKTKPIDAYNLLRGFSVSCGCYMRERASEAHLLNLAGHRFGRLIAMEIASGRGKVKRWRCKCDCGAETIVSTTHLRSSHTQSCGCLHREKARERQLKHDHARDGFVTPEYRAWQQMINRCYRKTNKSYRDYGARGISVCWRWLASFEAFYADMGPRPSPSHSLDRIKNDRGYEPKNCRWATKMVQASNTRKNRMIEFCGETLHLSEWARRFGIDVSLLRYRLGNGWPVERAMTLVPVVGRNGSR